MSISWSRILLAPKAPHSTFILTPFIRKTCIRATGATTVAATLAICAASFGYWTLAPFPSESSVVANPVTWQEDENQDDPAPPPRPGRKKFGDTPRKRGRVVPNAPAVPIAPAVPKLGDIANVDGNRSVSRMVNNGNKTTVVKTEDQEIRVEESNQGVFIKLIKTYRRADLPMLEEKNPKLAEALKAFPDDMEGAMLEVAVTSTKRYEAASIEALEKDQPEAFDLYQTAMKAYQDQGGATIANGFNMGPGFPMMQGFNFGADIDKEIQQQMDEARQQMRQQMQQMRNMQRNQNGGSGFGFRFGN